MKCGRKAATLLFLIFFLGLQGFVSAAEKGTHHTVAIHVPSTLNLASSQQNIDLNFPGTQPGTETNAFIVSYTVDSNGMSQSDGNPALLAQLDSLIPGMNIRASMGNFSRTHGNTELAAVSSDFITIGSNTTVLAQKANSSGNGHLLRGNFPITYKAVADTELISGNYTRQLTVTLTDI